MEKIIKSVSREVEAKENNPAVLEAVILAGWCAYPDMSPDLREWARPRLQELQERLDALTETV